jgi:hypothetical protein
VKELVRLHGQRQTTKGFATSKQFHAATITVESKCCGDQSAFIQQPASPIPQLQLDNNVTAVQPSFTLQSQVSD